VKICVTDHVTVKIATLADAITADQAILADVTTAKAVQIVVIVPAIVADDNLTVL